MIQQEIMRVVSQREIARNIFELILEGAMVQQMKQPGQFVHILPNPGLDPLLRRPISVAHIDKMKNQFTVIYRAEGKGTNLLSQYTVNRQLDVLGPLGNGFPINATDSSETALLVGGGIGVPPLYELAKQLTKQGVETKHVLGFQSSEVVFYEKEFSRYGETYIATVDGSLGTKGFVTNVIAEKQLDFDVIFACGPTPMLNALQQEYKDKKGFLSMEQRMGCGIGACFACVCHVNEPVNGKDYVKVCSDGPVFPIGRVVLT
ncbi:dihydroorotate dehydrogenase electron transfer subunit [Lederbergia galactosidilytica]|uniref:Dihydroorotate dehydrogenase B (NAD(+)), electron transfer subunit n=1 Tax=Lederbergia galactosidilytica TaxID=217031 RepID=A0A177ZYN8_9BACI|nr:dihydroorotate dehydrogenase electron transfer subunit [Lederbergia galactosidilytica]KRG13531.1 dihydroorotate dehydrogenase [Virgibacillus soli]MBP1913714.1 dihydroorotate dehydrogenase electron transfer subunit [Lederbergia galactosidilytica]OAK72609.1 dihydroorotate dehydrogenase [Lederbergia galactosidilytica]